MCIASRAAAILITISLVGCSGSAEHPPEQPPPDPIAVPAAAGVAEGDAPPAGESASASEPGPAGASVPLAVSEADLVCTSAEDCGLVLGQPFETGCCQICTARAVNRQASERLQNACTAMGTVKCPAVRCAQQREATCIRDRCVGRVVGARLMIQPWESASFGLPAIGWTMTLDSLSALAFDLPGSYFSASGPPGGPALVRADVLRGELRSFVETATASANASAVVFGKTSTTEIAGRARKSLAYFTGEEMAKTAWCAIEIRAEKTAGAAVLRFGGGAGAAEEPSCELTFRTPLLEALRSSLRLETAE